MRMVSVGTDFRADVFTNTDVPAHPLANDESDDTDNSDEDDDDMDDMNGRDNLPDPIDEAPGYVVDDEL